MQYLLAATDALVVRDGALALPAVSGLTTPQIARLR
jgi:hypothetical protein